MPSQEGPGLRAGPGGSILSSGCSSLDAIFGGGFPLEALVVIFQVRHRKSLCRVNTRVRGKRNGQHDQLVLASQDAWAVQARALVTQFLAEGVACGHQILHASSCEEEATLETRLPRICAGAKQETIVAPGAAQELQIAWQYRRCVVCCLGSEASRWDCACSVHSHSSILHVRDTSALCRYMQPAASAEAATAPRAPSSFSRSSSAKTKGAELIENCTPHARRFSLAGASRICHSAGI
jgi:hypothetical protein